MSRVSRPRTVLASVCAGALLSVLSITASAQEPHEVLDPAWQQAIELLDGVFTPEQQTLLNELSFAAAVGNLCDRYSLDKEKFAAGFQQLSHAHEDSMSNAEQAYFQNHLMFSYGVTVGLFMAEGSMDRDGFCRQAAEHQNDPDIPHFWR